MKEGNEQEWGGSKTMNPKEWIGGKEGEGKKKKRRKAKEKETMNTKKRNPVLCEAIFGHEELTCGRIATFFKEISLF